MPETDASAPSSARAAWGHGLATISGDGTVLDTWFPAPQLGTRPEAASVPLDLENAGGPDDRIGDGGLIARDRLDVAELTSQGDRTGGEVEGHAASLAIGTLGA